jgi:nicotinate-nucleotide--dimethylbenzimidazole phosphoribosyltransferase
MRRVTEVRDGRRRCLALRAQPQELLEAIGSAELAALAAFVLQAAARRTPVVLDGVLACAAAAVAFEAEARAVRWWCVADLGPDPAEAIAQTRLGQQPILTLGSSLGDGTAGALAVGLLQAAIRAGR